MARGGFRPGAGRPKGTGKSDGTAPKKKSSDGGTAASGGEDFTPLKYMLRIMNDASVDNMRRDRMAIAAAPFVHQRGRERPTGMKEQQQRAAEVVTGKFAPPAPPTLVVHNENEKSKVKSNAARRE